MAITITTTSGQRANPFTLHVDEQRATQLHKLSKSIRTYQRRARNLERQRADAIRQALADGWTHARIAEATGLTRGRINQLAHPTG